MIVVVGVGVGVVVVVVVRSDDVRDPAESKDFRLHFACFVVCFQQSAFRLGNSRLRGRSVRDWPDRSEFGMAF